MAPTWEFVYKIKEVGTFRNFGLQIKNSIVAIIN